MPTNLQMDAKVDALLAATDTAEWAAALQDVIRSGFLSDRNPFGALAKQAISIVQIPTGAIAPWAGAADSPPDGWLVCAGQLVSKVGEPDLWRIFDDVFLERRFGPYTATHFRLPDLRRRVVIGWGAAKPDNSLGPDNAVGATGGRETVTLGSTTMPAHGHLMSSMTLVAVGSHTHQVYEFTTQTGSGPGHFAARRDFLASSTSATILDQADRHIHFLGGHTDMAGTASPAPVTVSGTRLNMNWIIRT